MKNHQISSGPRSRVKSKSNTLLYTVGASILLFVVSFYFYTKEESVNAHSNSQSGSEASVSPISNNQPASDAYVNTQPGSESVNEIPINLSSSNLQVSEGSSNTRFNNQQIEETSLSAGLNSQQTRVNRTGNSNNGNFGYSEKHLDSNPQALSASQTNDISVASAIGLETDSTQPIDLSTIQSDTYSPLEKVISPNKIREGKEDNLIRNLNTFYEHLDQQSYMKDFELNTSSKVHFSRLLQRLNDAPPVVANETNDLFTILKNTAHFFRIIGKENIIVLKGILDREKASFEDVLETFYALTDYPEALEQEYDLTLSQDILYDYAGFFLNTMGGRLYLFRRDSASRMTVSFYAIQVVDRAIREGNNRHGIDLLPAIVFLIDEMESTGKRLLRKEDYLDTLYDLKEMNN